MSDELIDKAPVFLSAREARAAQSLIERTCSDDECRHSDCRDMRRTVGALKRLITKLALVRAALDGGRDDA